MGYRHMYKHITHFNPFFGLSQLSKILDTLQTYYPMYLPTFKYIGKFSIIIANPKVILNTTISF